MLFRSEDFKNLLGEDLCLLVIAPRTVRRMVRVDKESPGITDGKLQKLVRSSGQNVSQTTIKHQPIKQLFNHKLFKRVARKASVR